MMHSRLLPATLLFWMLASAHAYDFRAVAQQHIEPAYRLLAMHTVRLERVADDYCAEPSTARLQALRSSYRQAFLAWQGAEHLRFGPVQFLSREHRFALWPDKRGAVGKHLARLIEDPALQGEDFDISRKSVAVQGFSALERLLFDGQSTDAASCRLIIAIAGNLQQMAADLVDDWFAGDDPYVAYFADPGIVNPVYGSVAELAGQLLNSLYTELELMTTQKLARPLGDDIEKARGRRAEGWRSQGSLDAMAANLDACHDLYRRAFAPELDGSAPHPQIEAAFQRVHTALRDVDAPLSQAVALPGQRVRLQRLGAELSGLQQRVARDLAGTLNLSLGFNSLDGD